MINRKQQINVSRGLVGAFLGAFVSSISWAVIQFLGMHSVVNDLDYAASSPNSFLLDVAFAPIRYIIIFAAIGTTVGAITGALQGVRTIKSRQKQTQVNQSSSDDSWPSPATPPVT